MSYSELERFFDRASEGYDAVAASHDCDSQLMTHASALFERRGFDRGTLLDVGCGTGMLIHALGVRFEYTGIDISSKMLDLARQRGYATIKRPMMPQLNQMDNDSFDYVLALSSLYYVPHARAVIDEMKRVSRIATVFTLEVISPEFIQRSSNQVYDHSHLELEDAVEDVTFRAWNSPSQGTSVYARLVCLDSGSNAKVSPQVMT